jgi:hypothetical protein
MASAGTGNGSIFWRERPEQPSSSSSWRELYALYLRCPNTPQSRDFHCRRCVALRARHQKHPPAGARGVFHDPKTGYFGYRYFFESRPPPTLAACDPHAERVWEEASDADENKILISRSYKPGSVRDLLSRTLPMCRAIERQKDLFLARGKAERRSFRVIAWCSARSAGSGEIGKGRD